NKLGQEIGGNRVEVADRDVREIGVRAGESCKRTGSRNCSATIENGSAGSAAHPRRAGGMRDTVIADEGNAGGPGVAQHSRRTGRSIQGGPAEIAVTLNRAGYRIQ